MKRLLLLLALCLLVAAPVAALSLNFQVPEHNTSVHITNWTGVYPDCYVSATVSVAERRWIESTDAKNSYIGITEKGSCGFNGFAPMNKQQTTYAAATFLGQSAYHTRCTPGVVLLDYGGSVIATIPSGDDGFYKTGRWEVKIDGDTANLYINGTLYRRTSGIATNPYYIVFGQAGATKSCINTTECGYNVGGGYADESYWDDFVYGQAEIPVISGLPESTDDNNNEVVILKDMVNTATKGTAFENNHTIINSNYLYGNWARGNATSVPPDTPENETIQLVYRQDTLNNKVIATNYTGTDYYGDLAWDLNDIIFDPGEPYGYYALYWPDHDYYSNQIFYEAGGASVTWDKDDYSQGTTANVIYAVQETGYWDTSLYTYRVSINDIYGVEKTGLTLTERTGTLDYTFTSDDDAGVYYVKITATPNTGGNAIWLAVDYAELSEYGMVTGYVNDQLGNPIEGANVTFDQGIYSAIVSSGYDGNYTTLPFFITGTELLCNVTATGYRQHYYTILPMSTKTKNINFTLPSNSLSFTGLGIDGVAMEGYLTPGTINIINGYGNPIPYAVINITNATTMESYPKTASVTGHYICDVGTTCNLVFNQTYAVEGTKTGYQNSSIYLVKPQGVLT